MKSKLSLFLVVFFAISVCSKASPVEFSELSLMLKHGIPSSDLVVDVKSRKLAKPPTEAELAELKRLGATQELMSAISNPANQLIAEKVVAFQREKELALAEHFLVIGTVITISDGKMLVVCPGLPLKTTSPAQYIGKAIITGTLPVIFKLNAPTDMNAVNCETRKIGRGHFTLADGQVEEVPVMEMVKDIGKSVLPIEGSGPLQAENIPKRQEVVFEEGKCYHLSDPKIVPGGGPDVWIRLVGADQFNVLLQFTQNGLSLLAPKSKFQIIKGLDGSGKNLTPVYKNAEWIVYWKDTVGAFPGTGVFLIEHR
ncbi:MAG: hypothetical protein WCH43_04590 [Verrucomicrobiota bacterium]